MAQLTKGFRLRRLMTVVATTTAGVLAVSGTGMASASPLDDIVRASPGLGSLAGPGQGFGSLAGPGQGFSPRFVVDLQYIDSDIFTAKIRPSANVTITPQNEDRCASLNGDGRGVAEQVSKDERTPGRVTPGGSHTLGFTLSGSSARPGCGGHTAGSVQWQFRVTNGMFTTTFTATLNESNRLTTDSPSNPNLVQLVQQGNDRLIVQVQI
ncbi:hypothetical protein [Rhodococcus sp. IEGM 1379]|uniref:hypothetical protein n=1 Tax=Rhodococcus sp. IEGM 1379 TaxID=3047086 RepID=UPI0024B77EFB|nr:hypothetical protein [Rhodococcus sp. IEGM 1379]MDI9918176.1 hypothetical protein [Rhodococcus sp. IEGM 1379]